MEYLGAFRKRKIDSKGRLLLPSEWINDSEFVFEVESIQHPGEGWLSLYTKEVWKREFDAKTSPAAKMIFSRRATFVKIDKQNRLLLPKEYSWKCIDLVGMGNYIAIVESAVWAGFFLMTTY